MAIRSEQGAEPTRRLFIGLRPPSEVAERLEARVRPTLADASGDLPPGVRVMGSRDLHLTLLFLGAFPEARIPELTGALGQEIRGLDAPELSISGTGGFPSLERPRVLWLGIEEQEEADGRLHALHNRVSQAAFSMGFRPGPAERRRGFRPHLTVARVRRHGGDGPAADPAFRRLGVHARWLPVEVVLFESRPDMPEERYRALAAFPLVVHPG